MTEHESTGRGLLLVTKVLSVVSGFLAIAAVIAYATGEKLPLHGTRVHTHTDAAWVLGSLAGALGIAAFLAWREYDRPKRLAWREANSLS